MAIHHISACADPRTEGSAAFEQQLREDIRLRHPTLRARPIRICGYRTRLCRAIDLPHLREYTVQVVADLGIPEANTA